MNSITTKNDEIDELSQKLKTKTEEAECLAENVRSLHRDIDGLKTTPSVAEEPNHMFQVQQNTRLKEAVTNGRTANAAKPLVWLIGTSNMDGINADKLTTAASVKKYIAYTFDMVRDTLSSLKAQEDQPSAIVLHILTNELKSKDPESCVSEVKLIASEFGSQWPAAKICISLTTPRTDDPTYFTKGQIINAVIKEKLADRVIIDHSNMLIEGYPNAELLSDKDGYHLNYAGTSMLASNIKQALHACLNLPYQEPRYRSRSRSRTPYRPRGRYPPNVRGRGRGRGYPRQY